MNEFSLQDIISIGETVDLECKAAQGRDGNGEVPGSFWETYSAMANTDGGEVYLGIEEKPAGVFNVLEIKDIGKVKKSLWDTLHGKNKVNRNILSDANIQVILVNGKQVIRITVPRARRQDRPVHLGPNPFGNTYLRRHEGDYKADDETIRRMIAESVEDSRDDRVLDDFGIEDLEKETIAAYRNRFSAVKPENPWLALSAEEFLNKIGAFGKDRATGKSGLRVAGLLMFGRFDTIKEVFPNYMVDYQERSEARAEVRWIDRVVPDGTWSGNLYDFFQKTYRKLTTDLKIPFQLREGVRSDDTPIHEAVREALTNTLIHADYTGRVSILVVKRPDMFGFRNPGLMRVSVEQAILGGLSDCRNRRIQDMFRYVGLGDHAGSGIPKIYRNWKEQHWRLPLLREDPTHEQTLLELRMISLLPEESVKMLDDLFGERFRKLPELERIILITSATEEMVNHDRIKEIASDHPKDISAALAYLVHEKMLIKQGETRASFYRLPRKLSIAPSSLFQDSLVPNSQDLPANSQDLPANSQDLKAKLSEILNSLGLQKIPGKMSNNNMRDLILRLCDNSYISLHDLSKLLDRDQTFIQQYYISKMLSESLLELKYTNNKNHPDQAYRKKQA
ncbi:MAG: putative DNA binding domain-containing protein [Elusimicrobia bacterium]|nr:putative DNA binding domain-containing protein [Elusimicrobiota bacterium]